MFTPDYIPLDIETLPAADEAGELKRIAATIEAPAQMKKAETIAAWHNGEGDYAGVKQALVLEQYHKQGFNGAKGRICSLTFALGSSEELHSFYLLPPDQKVVAPEGAAPLSGVACFATEAELLTAFFDALVPNLNGRPPYFVGHYIAGFDLRFLFQRCVVNRVRPGVGLSQDGRHEQQFYDTQTGWAGYKGTISANALSEALGITPMEPGEIDGSQVFAAYKAGNHYAVLHHNQHDVRRAQQQYRRLTFKQ